MPPTGEIVTIGAISVRQRCHDGVPPESQWLDDVEDRDAGVIPIHVVVLIPASSPSPSPSTVVVDGE
ncbi:hypothetical protein TIFTF001_033243 [Ficus carica]|uniref:Uncharacterized protein n=1 Tax=Ficus carica TaxID=3494 RepID=A0AA88DYR5_FICCA|nr:hypothetical protein TIFTF001_033243 [Ficus carica]